MTSTYEDLAAAIGRAVSPARDSLVIELVNKLLPTLISSLALKAMDQEDRVGLTVDVCTAVSTLLQYLETVRPHLDKDGVADAFRLQIEALQAKGANEIAHFRKVRDAYEALLAQKQALEESANRIRSLEEELRELQELRARATPERVAALLEEVEQLRIPLVGKKAVLEGLERSRQEFAEENTRVEEALQAARMQGAEGVTRWLGQTEKLGAFLREGAEAADERLIIRRNELRDRKQRYEVLMAQVTEAEQAIDELTAAEEATRAAFVAHFTVNERARYAAEAAGIPPELQVAIRQVREASERVGPHLREFDEELRKLLRIRDDLQAKVRRLNLTNTAPT